MKDTLCNEITYYKHLDENLLQIAFIYYKKLWASEIKYPL